MVKAYTVFIGCSNGNIRDSVCFQFHRCLYQSCNAFGLNVIMGGTETLMNRMGAFRNLSCSLSTVNYSVLFV